VPSTIPESHPRRDVFRRFAIRTVSGGIEEDRSCFHSARDLPSFTPPSTLPWIDWALLQKVAPFSPHAQCLVLTDQAQANGSVETA
jgi:hypothetical protein